VTTAVLSIMLSLFVGYGFAKFRFRGRSGLMWTMLATTLLPFSSILVPMIVITHALGLQDTLRALIVPFALTGQGIFLARQFMLQVPRDLIEAARVEGAGELRIFISIVLPLMGPRRRDARRNGLCDVMDAVSVAAGVSIEPGEFHRPRRSFTDGPGLDLPDRQPHLDGRGGTIDPAAARLLPDHRAALPSRARSAVGAQRMTSGRIIGGFIFPAAWEDRDRFVELVAALGDCGVNALFTESETYDPAAIEIARKRGLSFYAGVSCFSDHANHNRLLTERPELWPILETGERRPAMEWYIGINPTDRRHQEHVLTCIRSIAETCDIDGLVLDFIRWPLHWELELRPGAPPPLDSSFDAGTIAAFERASGIAVPRRLESTASIASWIKARHSSEWLEFKCRVITDFVAEARRALADANAHAKLGIYLVPAPDRSREELVGQRLVDLAPLVDLVAPMLYHNGLLQPPRWVEALLAEVAEVAGRKSLPVLQVDSGDATADLGPPMMDQDFEAVLTAIAEHPDVAGWAFFTGNALVNTGRGALVRKAVGGRG
jgi:hypothetical protein